MRWGMGQDPKNKAHFLEAFQIMDLILSNGWDSKTGYFKGQPAAASIWPILRLVTIRYPI